MASPRPSSPDFTKKKRLVNMQDLRTLLTSEGYIRLLNETSVHYRAIGTLLLNNDSGAIVSAIELAVLGDPVRAVTKIYEQWIGQDEDHTWKKLCVCFRNYELNSLARKLELHFGLPSPSGHAEATSPDLPSHPMNTNAETTEEESVSETVTGTPSSTLNDATSSEPKLRDLANRVASNIPHKWGKVAIQLEISSGDRRAIENDKDKAFSRFVAVLEQWNRNNSASQPYTWKTIVTVLKSASVDESRLAEELEKDFC